MAAGTALATIAAYAGLSAVPRTAQAAGPGVDDIRTFFGLLANQTIPSLAGVGALGQQLKTLNLVPAGDSGIGLGDLMSKAKTDVLDAHSSWATASSLSDVADEIDGASHALSDSYSGGNPARSVTFHASSTAVDSDGVQTLHVSVQATRTNNLVGLNLSSADPEFAISSGNGVRAVLTLNAAFTIANNPTTGQTWLVATDADHPSASISVDTSIPAPTGVHAGIGILGVQLASDSTFQLLASASTTWSDPNNDGRLAFLENGVAGELATTGSGPGIVTAQLDSASIHATLHVQARATTSASLNLPTSLDATVHVDQTDLVNHDPIVSLDNPTALDGVRDFLTLSPRDLAQGIAQATSALMVLQQRSSVPLPFMSGDVTDAITAAEGLVKFLQDNVAPTTSPTTPGAPSFASIQDLLDLLHNATGMPTGTTLDVSGASYDQTLRKLYFTIQATRTSGHSRPLDAVAPSLTGSGAHVHYTETTLQDDDANFDPVVDGRHDFRDSLKGRTVQVGASSAAIKDVLSPHSLLLDPHAVASAGSPDPTSAWRAGVPADGAAYVITADDPKTGLVQLGNALQDGGIANANATTPQATFDPAYSLTIPLALDLRPADTEHCDPDHPSVSGNCPFSYHDPVSGVTRIISSLPSAPDRILIKGDTDLLTADVKIDTHVDVNATVGFFGVNLSGDLHVCDQGLTDGCTNGTASDHFFALHLNALPGADAQGYVPLKTVFTQVQSSPTTAFTAGLHGQANAHLSLSIPGAANFFPPGTDLGIDLTMPSITSPGTVTVDQHIFDTLSGLNFDPSNPQALLTQLIAILRAVHDRAGSLSTPGLDTKLPLVGKSLSELIEAPYQSTGLGTVFSNTADNHGTLVDPSGHIDDSWIGRTVTVGSQSLTVARVENGTAILDQPWAPIPTAASALTASNELDAFLTDLSNNTPTSLQDLVGRLGSRLGTGSTAGFTYLPASGSDPQRLKLTIDWKRSAQTAVPLGLHFSLGDLVGSTGEGLLHVSANGEVALALTFPLTTAAVDAPLDNLTVDKSASFIKAGVSVTGGDDVSLQANLGPFVLGLGGTGTQIHAGLNVSLDAGSSGEVSLDSFVGGLNLHVVTDTPAPACSSASAGDTPLALCAFIPATLNDAPVGSDAQHSAFILRLPLSDNLSDVVNLSGKVTSDPSSPDRFEYPDGLGDAFANSVLNLLSLHDGILGYLTFLENAFQTASFNGKLPLIGHDLQAGADFVGNIRSQIDAAFGSAPEDSSDAGTIKTFLNGPVKDALPVLPGVTFTPHVYCGGTTECADTASGASITGISITTDIGGGDVAACPSATDATEATDCAVAAHVPVDLGLPGLSVKSTDGSGVQGGIAWRVHLTLGIDRNNGFFVATGDDTKPEIKVAAHLRVPNAQLQLAFINVGLTPLHPDVPEFQGTFAIDLTKPGTSPCYTDSCPTNSDQLTLADVTSHPIGDIAHVQLTAAATIDWRLRARADAVLPGIGADFHLHWDWDSSAPSTTDTPSHDHGLTVLGFDNIVLDPGSFLRGAVGQVVGKIAQVYKPIKPILDTIQAPIPVLSDLSKAVGGDDVTIESLATAFSTVAGGPESLATFFRVIDIIKQVGDTVAGLGASQCGAAPPADDPHADGFCIDLGAIDLVKDKALNTQNSPDSAASSYTVATGAPSASSFKSDLTSKGGFNPDAAHDASNPTYGFTFPLFDDPTKFFGIIVGQDVDLVDFDSGPLTIGFDFSQEFGPVYAPPPVMVIISGGASVSLHIVAGFDTYGIRTAVEQGRPAEVLNGLFFRTTDADGKPIPVVHFEGFIAAGAAVSVAFLEVGIEGGIKLTVDFTWNDPNNDGKFRFGEFLSAAINNPICLFNVGGELSLFIKVFITLGIDPFSVSFDFTLANIKLLDFSLKPNCTPPPPKLGGVDGHTLYIYAGKFSHSERGDSAWDSHNTADETWVIRQVPHHAATSTKPATNGAIVVQGLGITESFDDGAADNQITAVVLDGRGYDGKLSITLTGGEKDQPFTKSSFIYTGNKDDVIRGGAGHSVIDAGGGADQVTTVDRQDLRQTVASSPTAFVAGGPGKDTITVGNAADWVEGDGEMTGVTTQHTASTHDTGGNVVTLTDAIDPSTARHHAANELVSVSGPDADTISVGLGGSTVYGGGGDDIIGTANDAPQAALSSVKNDPAQLALYRAQPSRIIGGDGADRIKGGSAGDTIFTGDETMPGENGLGSADNAGSTQNTVDTGTGNDTVYGSQAKDYVTTHSLATTDPVQHATVYGGGGDDVLIGGAGTDQLYGGPGNDYVIAEPATVSGNTPLVDVLGAARSVTHLPLSTPSSTKTLVGGGGSDRIYGGDGASVIYGDRTDQACPSAPSDVFTQPTETTQPSGLQAQEYDAADLVLGGNGIDRVYAGGGDDHVFTNGGSDTICGAAGKDDLHAGGATDGVWGGTGDDQIYGDEGADDLFGNDNNDEIYGQDGTDLIEGNNGVDTISGGALNDVIIGGSSAAGEPDVNDFLYGDSGDDVLVGDDADATTAAAYPTDLSGSPASAGGADYVFGGAGDDRAYGGLAGDHMYGGLNNDHLEGNTAHDYVYGEDGADDIIGGSSQIVSGSGVGAVGRPDAADDLDGGAADDVIAGDNAVIEKVGAGLGSTLTRGRGLTSERSIQLLDLGYGPATGLYGGDTITGAAGNDVVFGERGVEVIHGAAGDDYLEGGQDGDTIDGDDGQDDIVGGSYADQSTRQGQLDAGDTIRGGNDGDVAIGDNGLLTRDPDAGVSDLVAGRGIAGRAITLYDVGDSPTANTSGPDWIQGQDAVDVLLGQGDSDRVQGGNASDYVEGGPAADWLEGNAGSDDIVGGSSELLAAPDTGDDASGQPDGADVMWGGTGDDVITGDNARVTRLEPYNELTYRIGTAVPGTIEERRSIRLLDLRNAGSYLIEPSSTRFGGDFASGQEGNDVLLGQDGNDSLSGGSDDDYVEGQGGAELILGDLSLAAGGVAVVDPTSVGTASSGYDADTGVAGQDDIMGGSSRPGFRDTGDEIHGNGAADFILGDGGTIVRDVLGSPGSLADRVNVARYPATLPAGAAKLRFADSDYPSTRFCTTAQATCEPLHAYGDDLLFGDAGDDVMYGQDGADQMWGGTEDDDMFGELGNDKLWGESGDDAILGDRGGLVDVYQDGSNAFSIDNNQVPKIHYDAFVDGTVTRKVDLIHDNNGAAFVGSGSTNPMPHDGMLEGGDDQIRGGAGRDSIHAGFGDDVANGDSGGDVLFGDDGADVLWGGRGNPDVTGDANARGTKDAYVDYLFGGKGGTSAASLAGANGSDLIDWRPRGSATTPGSTCATQSWPVDLLAGPKGTGTTIDPCLWFQMTDITSSDATTYQHHQGIDWMYGGWDRDILQGDVADNGPNLGDRLLDWNGAYNLYTHCNAAYGGFNDVRQHSPAQQDFLQKWLWSTGGGQVQSDALTSGTSAFDELALVYPGVDNAHGSGSAYPSTPGHFDNPNACGA